MTAGGEVPVERGDAHPRAAGDVLQRRVRAALGEDLARGGEQRVVVARGVPAVRALGRDDLVDGKLRDGHGGLRVERIEAVD